MSRTASRRRIRRILWRTLAGLACGLAIWAGFSRPYERALARTAEIVLRVFERPAVTRLEAIDGEIRVDRTDLPPASPRPGLPASDIHFNLVVLAALLASAPATLRPGRVAAAAAILFAVHVLALVCQVESLYATRMGAWSEAHYGVFARNAWAAAFHFYQIAGRFAAPFAIWWGVAGWPITAAMPHRAVQKAKTK